MISKIIDKYLIDLADIHRFVMRFFNEVFVGPFEFKEIIRQCYEIGVKSLPLMSLTGFIIGVVFTKQSRPSLADFGAQAMLPALISIAVVRALAPLVTALIASGKVGSQIGAELGSMKVTEQIDAMEVSGINPFKFLVVSRVVATSVMIPVLMFYVAFVALMGAFMNINQNEATSMVVFFTEVFDAITFKDVFAAVFKSFVFGFTIGIVGCYQGYTSSKGTEGVGRAANWAVVMSMFLIFIEELLIVQLLQLVPQ
ncbi:MlaE family ABC transporter permease [Albibacterium indicum]|uniref:MlaE family ABC transporter permease n=1 Tax=Albibacterium indicum TaxID=2292082 RepID=UPI000E51D4A3|nr:ABC transporter permease [Pedobacter indicus]